ncbi:MAG: inositol monophosphatase family protein [Anaerolineales bacterium]|jgi:myo-inositol-1(or 4)-monophosphatase
MDKSLNFATQLARQSGELLLKYYRNHNIQASIKPDRSIVTEADLAADQLITQSIIGNYPQDNILSEERHTQIDGNSNSATWVVDPLDGTTNFSLGLPFWGVSMARLVSGIPEIAVLYFPLLDELYTVRQGYGARMNGQPIQVKPPIPDHPAAFFSCCGRTHRHYHVTVPYKPRVLGSAAYGFAAVARGIAVLGFEATPKIWDIAGAWLLVPEAGGVISPYHGDSPFPLLPGIDYSDKNFPTVAAATPHLLARAREQIQPR